MMAPELARRFESVFSLDPACSKDKPGFRIKGSGVQGEPTEAPMTDLIVGAIQTAGADVRGCWSGSAANATSHHLEADFLDGGLRASTGDYWYSPRGAWLMGEDAVAWVAHLLGLVPPGASKHRNPPRLPGALRDAYERTDYVILSQPEVHVRVGDLPCAALEDLLSRAGCRQAAILTAWNPYSRRLSSGQNRLRQLQLRHDLTAAAARVLPAEGRDREGIWEAEESALALGLDPERARELMRRYQQHAIVWLSLDEPVSLWFQGG